MKTKPCLFIFLLLWSFATNLMAANNTSDQSIFQVDYKIVAGNKNYTPNADFTLTYPIEKTLYFDNLADAMDFTNYEGYYPFSGSVSNPLCVVTATVTLLSDYADDKTVQKTIPIDQYTTITLDLKSKGYNITGNYKFKVGSTTPGALTVLGDDKKTTLNAQFDVAANSSLTIDGGDYFGVQSYVIFIDDSYDEVTINGGIFYGNSCAMSIYGKSASDGNNVLINAGRFSSSNLSAILYKLDNGAQPPMLGECRGVYKVEFALEQFLYQGNFIVSEDEYHNGVVVDEDYNELFDFIVREAPAQPYVVLSDDKKTLTFYYDGCMPNENAWYVWEYDDILLQPRGFTPGWTYDCGYVTTVVFDKSFSNYRPTSCNQWFSQFFNLTKIVDIHNLITDDVKDMVYMFESCQALKEIDLSHFNTSNVEAMYNMFEGCSVLESLDLSSFNLSRVEDMSGMFLNCSALTNITFGKDSKTSYLENIGGLFSGCKLLTILDLRSFSTSKPLFTNDAFASCENLTTIIVPDDWDNSNFIEQIEERGVMYDILPFDGSEKIVGGNGTQWITNASEKDYLRIDGKDGKPGLLTTLPYTIKYVEEDGKEATYEGLPTEYYLYDENIATLKDYSKDPINIPSPSKKGYVFLGWSEGLNTGLTAVTKEVKIDPATDRYNRVYKANWKKRITAEVDGNISYPDADNLTLYCDGKETTITLPFTITYGKATGFEIKFGDNKFTAKGELKANDKAIVVKVPDGITTGVYEGELVFTGAFDPETNPNDDPDSDPYPITLTVNVVKNTAVQLYTDVLIADNHDGIYNAYQWYKDDEPLAGANLQYYSEPKFDYTKSYSVELSGDGGKIMSCPVKWLSTAKVLNPRVKVYPNPAKQNELFTLEILDFDETQNYDIVIFTANGTLVKKISNVEKQTSVSLPAGIYSGSLISGDDKKGFKLIVK